MQEERMRILKMLEEQKVSAEDAARLLDAVTDARAGEGEAQAGKKIRVRVTDPATGKQTVNLTVPVGLARFAVKFIPAKKKEELRAEGIDVDALLASVISENIGNLVDVESDDGNVQISIE